MKKSDTPFLDRVILHNKNADERLFDMILRIITFIILIIIVWIYADIAKAKASDSSYIDVLLLGDNELSLKPYFNNGDWSTVHNEYPDTPYYTNNFSFVAEIPGHVVLTSDMNYQDCYIAIGRCYSNGSSDSAAVLMIPKDIVDNNHVYLCNNGYIYSDIAINTNYVWFNKRYSEDTSRYETYNINIPVGYTEFRSIDQYGSSFYWYLTNMDYLTCDSLSELEDYFSNGESEDCFNCNYLSINDLIDSPNNDEVESNSNHLYLNDIQVGLSCNRKSQPLESSNIIIGVDVDDWISNHMKSYNLKVDYDINFSASFNGVSSPLNGHYTTSQFNNLALFNNDAYSYGVSEIANESNFPLTSLNSQDVKVISNSQPYYGLFPTILNYVQKEISNEWTVWTPSSGHNIVFNDFSLTVTCTLYSGIEYGGTYVKEFDFLTGAESVKRADILTNTNPWNGDPNPQLPSNVPESGLSNNGGYGGGNTSVNVNVSGQKIPMNVQNQQEINNTLTNYTNAFETFSNSIRSLADTESQNNFYAVLSNTVPMIPGVNIYLQYVALTCGVMLILLVLKIFLF